MKLDIREKKERKVRIPWQISMYRLGLHYAEQKQVGLVVYQKAKEMTVLAHTLQPTKVFIAILSSHFFLNGDRPI